jgi:serine/threonine-protein kinase
MIFMQQNKIENMVGQKAELDNYIGQILNNRYLIKDLIGKGGMGRVYLAEDTAKGGMPIADSQNSAINNIEVFGDL